MYLITILALSMINESPTVTDTYARLTAVSGFGILSLLLFYFTMRVLEKEEALQNCVLEQNMRKIKWQCIRRCRSTMNSSAASSMTIKPAKLYTGTSQLRQTIRSLGLYYPYYWDTAGTVWRYQHKSHHCEYPAKPKVPDSLFESCHNDVCHQ